MAKLVSNVYGEALFELAMEQDRLDAYLEESQGVLDVLRDNQLNHNDSSQHHKRRKIADGRDCF